MFPSIDGRHILCQAAGWQPSSSSPSLFNTAICDSLSWTSTPTYTSLFIHMPLSCPHINAHHRSHKKHERRIKKAQKALSRKKKGSKNRKKLLLAGRWLDYNNAKDDWQWNLAKDLVDK